MRSRHRCWFGGGERAFVLTSDNAGLVSDSGPDASAMTAGRRHAGGLRLVRVADPSPGAGSGAEVVLVLMSSPGLGTHPCSRLWARRSADRRPGRRGRQTLPRDRASAGIPTRSSVAQRTGRPRRRAGHRSGVRPGPACPGRRTRSGTERVGPPARIATTPPPVTAPEVTACGNNARRHTTDRPTPCPEGARTLTCQNTSRTRLGKPPGAGARAHVPPTAHDPRTT
jgi:hypothetical protein